MTPLIVALIVWAILLVELVVILVTWPCFSERAGHRCNRVWWHRGEHRMIDRKRGTGLRWRSS